MITSLNLKIRVFVRKKKMFFYYFHQNLMHNKYCLVNCIDALWHWRVLTFDCYVRSSNAINKCPVIHGHREEMALGKGGPLPPPWIIRVGNFGGKTAKKFGFFGIFF